MRSSFGDSMRSARQPTPEVTTVERPLPVGLEDLFHGVIKKMKIKRKMFDDSGKRTTTDTPSWRCPSNPASRRAARSDLRELGIRREGGQRDLVFIVEEVSLPA